ncbi:hypothetical protein ABZ172_14200 [Streptomyces sp. NPDC006296]|uniref:hypothetical protein n=1 Tax=Streptomyces sp. NPDC006296 TaxID=3156746 RepID=UPI0033B9850F
MDALQVSDDMTLEVALSVMAGARTGHLSVCDDDGLCTQLVTQARLAAVRDSPGYTDRLRLRDILGDSGPFAPPVATTTEAGCGAPGRLLAAPPAAEGRAGVGRDLAPAH